jgi:hypothetical protein
MTGKRLPDCVEQGFVVEGLLDKIHGPRLHGLDCQSDIAMPGHHDNRDRISFGTETALEFETVDAGHSHIRHDASVLSAGSVR